MADNADNVTQTTGLGDGVDALSEPLRAMRVRSGLLLREGYVAPWAVRIPSEQRLGAAISLPEASKVAAFHLVEAGELHVEHPGVGSLVLGPGEMAICFDGGAHTLSSGDNCEAVSVEQILADGPRIQRYGNSPKASGRRTSLICGFFQIEDSALNPLLTALPPVLTCSLAKPGELDCLGAVSRIIASEIDRAAPGGVYMIERLLEVLCGEAIRSHIEKAPQRVPNFFVGLRDPLVHRVLALIHARPGKNWSVQTLAGEVALSPSRMSARFKAAMGISVMIYLTRWRMHLACGQLAEGEQNLELIARESGYDSAPAFHRAFKRTVGVGPGVWRKKAKS